MSGGAPASQKSVWRRYMELPRYLRAVNGQQELTAALEELAAGLDFERLALVSGTTFTAQLAHDLAEALPRAGGAPAGVEANTESEVARLAATPALRDADAVVAVGGGKTIDVAKSVCEQVDLPVVTVPTQLTADGIASPVSVIRTGPGVVESRHARLPIGLVVDFDVLRRSPVESARAGLGDLVANACAVRDWRRAAAAGRESMDDFAALLAEAASDLVTGPDATSLDDGPLEDAFLHRLLQGLVLSGLAMEIAGSSRPCSGSEHLISHAIDRLYPGTARHGEQVAFGAVLCSRFQGEDWQALRELLANAGMQSATTGFGLSEAQVVAAVQAAPATRPGRYTVLDEIDLSDFGLAPMVKDVLLA
jgi:glycerol-1-phosphate dehydrogenase [NAD(P)+]